MLRISKDAALGERDAGAVADDGVIEQADVHQGERIPDALGDLLVGAAGFGDAGGVIVGDNHGGAIAAQRLFDDFTRMHAGTVDGAAEKLLELDQAVAIIQLW